MNITFDKACKQRIWQMVNRKIADKTCPFCGVTITGKNFKGAFWYKDEFRATDGSLHCLIAMTEQPNPVQEKH